MFGRGSRATSGAAVAAGEVGGEAHVARCSHMSGAQPTERHHKTQVCGLTQQPLTQSCYYCVVVVQQRALMKAAVFIFTSSYVINIFFLLLLPFLSVYYLF